MMNLESAQTLLAGQVRALPAVEMRLNDALGCRLAEVHRADIDLPSADVSMMDGYAARAADLSAGTALSVAFEIPAGHGPRELPRGMIARIFTGAVVPAGADVVVPQEQADVRPDGTVVLPALAVGRYLRRQAELCELGAPLADAGTIVTPQLIGLLGVTGAARVSVVPRPSVAVLSTGSELVAITERPVAGRIRDGNGAMLTALAQRADLPVTFCTRVSDDVDALRDVLTRAAVVADLIVTCGGVSVGDYDLVPQALHAVGAEIVFHRLSIKPGKPTLAARFGRSWVVGLPGNPVSALVAWRLFARPLGKALAGDRCALAETPESGVLVEPIDNPSDRTLLAPAFVTRGTGEARATLLPWKGSHDVVALSRANALALVDIGAKLNAGEQIRFYRLDE